MCNKKRYTKFGALYAITGAQHIKKRRKNKDKTIPVRSYYCRFCKGYHLTSQQRLNMKTGVIG